MSWCLALVGLFAADVQALVPTPILWGALAGTDFILAPPPRLFRGSSLGPFQKLTIQESSLEVRLGRKFPDGNPYFALRPDSTISQGRWCADVTEGSKRGCAVHINLCNGGPTQMWDRLSSDGGSKNKIQLKGSNLCLDVTDKSGDLNGAPIVLNRCENSIESWHLYPPQPARLFPSPQSKALAASSAMRHRMLSLISMAVLGTLAFGTRLFWWRKRKPVVVVSQGGVLLRADQGGVCLTEPFLMDQGNGATVGAAPTKLMKQRQYSMSMKRRRRNTLMNRRRRRTSVALSAADPGHESRGELVPYKTILADEDDPRSRDDDEDPIFYGRWEKKYEPAKLMKLQTRRYRASDWAQQMLSLGSSLTLKRIRQPLLFNSIITLGTCAAHGILGPWTPLSPIPHRILSRALALLLVFRTNSAYDRFMEARVQLGVVTQECRELASLVTALMSREQALPILSLIAAYPVVLKNYLRGERDMKQLKALMLSDELEALSTVVNQPQYVLARLRQLVYQSRFAGVDEDNMFPMLRCIRVLGGTVAVSERIFNSPMPSLYSAHLCRFLGLYTSTLPLVLVSTLGWRTLLVTFPVCWALMGIQEMGNMIEEPFNAMDETGERVLLQLGETCQTVQNDVRAIAAAGQTAKDFNVRTIREKPEASTLENLPRYLDTLLTLTFPIDEIKAQTMKDETKAQAAKDETTANTANESDTQRLERKISKLSSCYGLRELLSFDASVSLKLVSPKDDSAISLQAPASSQEDIDGMVATVNNVAVAALNNVELRTRMEDLSILVWLTTQDRMRQGDYTPSLEQNANEVQAYRSCKEEMEKRGLSVDKPSEILRALGGTKKNIRELQYMEKQLNWVSFSGWRPW